MAEFKSGDFVVLTGGSAFAGKIARLTCRAPDGDFRLPDGHGHIGCEAGDWVLEFAQKVPALMRGCQTPCMTKYLCRSQSQFRRLEETAGLEQLFGPMRTCSPAVNAS
ncbi:hypothetical protein ACJJWD_21595 [Comamonas testosteroni]|uniref:hypothetical protein n=1 Tax=Comamonas testosteroni TaxID=285 RepID=UPI00389A3A4D